MSGTADTLVCDGSSWMWESLDNLPFEVRIVMDSAFLVGEWRGVCCDGYHPVFLFASAAFR